MDKEQELSLSEILDINTGLSLALEHDFENFKLSYRIGKLAQRLVTKVENFSQARKKVVRKFGEKDKKGEVRLLPGMKGFDNAEKAIDELLKEKEVIKVPELKLSMFEKEKLKPRFYKLCDPILINDLD